MVDFALGVPVNSEKPHLYARVLIHFGPAWVAGFGQNLVDFYPQPIRGPHQLKETRCLGKPIWFPYMSLCIGAQGSQTAIAAFLLYLGCVGPGETLMSNVKPGRLKEDVAGLKAKIRP